MQQHALISQLRLGLSLAVLPSKCSVRSWSFPKMELALECSKRAPRMEKLARYRSTRLRGESLATQSAATNEERQLEDSLSRAVQVTPPIGNRRCLRSDCIGSFATSKDCGDALSPDAVAHQSTLVR